MKAPTAIEQLSRISISCFSNHVNVLLGSLIGVCFTSPLLNAQGFTVQLPTQGTFSIQTSVAVPDGGEMDIGGNMRYGGGSAQRGRTRATGSSSGYANASVSATIIDLDELDRLIRAEANTKPMPVDWSKVSPPNDDSDVRLDQATPDRPPAYAYMMAMNVKPTARRKSAEDARYYLSLASDARRQGHWTSVELYYQLAWEALPDHRRKIATDAFVKSKEAKAELDKKKKPSDKQTSL